MFTIIHDILAWPARKITLCPRVIEIISYLYLSQFHLIVRDSCFTRVASPILMIHHHHTLTQSPHVVDTSNRPVVSFSGGRGKPDAYWKRPPQRESPATSPLFLLWSDGTPFPIWLHVGRWRHNVMYLVQLIVYENIGILSVVLEMPNC